uniref:hypothetical protein n=1 Tax=Flaviflexus ciconiae TaxID=2496867 RepID=UPI0022499E8D|nr:hypothetical protein [Flaviflexus ciconiae]
MDGPFIKRLYHHDLAFRGSSNQRIIDLRASAQEGSAVLWESGRRDTEEAVPFLTPAAPRS